MNVTKDPRYKSILRMRDRDKLTFEEIGRRMGVTRQRAFQMYDRAVKRIKAQIEAKLVERPRGDHATLS